MGYRGAGGVTDRSGRAVELLFAALRDLSPGATGVIRVVRLDRHARNPSYLPGQIVFRVDTDKATRVFVEDATPYRRAKLMHTWEPHTPHVGHVRVHETSCCDEYQFASEAGVYFVLRWTGDGYEETGRGSYAATARTRLELTQHHRHATQATW